MKDNTPHADLDRITYERALNKAWDDLEERDLGDLASLSDSRIEDGKLLVEFFNTTCEVFPEQREVRSGGKDMGPFMSVLILHYLLGCTEKSPMGRVISFRQVPGGDVYFSAFKKRAIDSLVDVFGDRPSLLVRCGRSLGVDIVNMGSAAVQIEVFPKVPVTLVVWQGDDEVPSSGNILFDETTGDILPMEDISILGNLASSKLRREAQSLEQEDDFPEVTSRG